MTRRGNNPEDTAQRTAKTPEPRDGYEPLEIPEDYKHVENLKHGQIVQTLGGIVDEMLEDARQDAKGEANLMIRIMLLNQVALMRPEVYNEDAKLCLGEERYRRKVQRDLELDRFNVRQLTKRAANARVKIKQDAQKLKLSENKFEWQKKQMEKVGTIARSAQISLEHNEPMDPRAVYTKIAEIVGLQAPESDGSL